MGPHLFWLPAEKGSDGHYALLQSWASDVGLVCLLNTLQCPARMNRDDEISLISEQEWATPTCLALPIYAQQFPRWLFKLHRDSPWIIHYLPSISVHSNRQQISSCHTQGNKSICLPAHPLPISRFKKKREKKKKKECYSALNNVTSEVLFHTHMHTKSQFPTPALQLKCNLNYVLFITSNTFWIPPMTQFKQPLKARLHYHNTGIIYCLSCIFKMDLTSWLTLKHLV